MLLAQTSHQAKWNVLVLCTGNSARSIMAEALFNEVAGDVFRAFSAGSYPTGKVNPFAIAQLQKNGLPIGHYFSKSWDSFTGPDAPELDFVVTVCDNAANEPCPAFSGEYLNVHWRFPDPAAYKEEETATLAFQSVFEAMKNRIEYLKQPDIAADKRTLHQVMINLVDEIPYAYLQKLEG
ncbi:MAG: arsenate reductase ArsC [Gammaproteobacteria bacterium]|nr:arsenate reductase ArsC [Gammaproteobacteria bacterium]